MDEKQLRYALAQHLGKPLTPDVAAAIYETALAVVDDAIAIERFEPLVTAGGLVIRCERLRSILHEIHPLHERHWQETEKHRHGLPLAPDYAGMLQRERTGGMLQFTLRHEGELVGNLRMYLGTSMHTGTKFAEEDTLYIAPEHRGGYTAMRMLRYAEEVLLQIGVREIRADSKLVNGADRLMRAMRYTPVAIKFTKIFPDVTQTTGACQLPFTKEFTHV